MKARSLTPTEIAHLLAAPDRTKPEGARDYAVLLALLSGVKVRDICGMRLPELEKLPTGAKRAAEGYLRLDAGRRENLRSGGERQFVFQPTVNYRTLEFDRPLSPRQVLNIVQRWGEFSGIGKVGPRDLRKSGHKMLGSDALFQDRPEEATKELCADKRAPNILW